MFNRPQHGGGYLIVSTNDDLEPCTVERTMVIGEGCQILQLTRVCCWAIKGQYRWCTGG